MPALVRLFRMHWLKLTHSPKSICVDIYNTKASLKNFLEQERARERKKKKSSNGEQSGDLILINYYFDQ